MKNIDCPPVPIAIFVYLRLLYFHLLNPPSLKTLNFCTCLCFTKTIFLLLPLPLLFSLICNFRVININLQSRIITYKTYPNLFVFWNICHVTKLSFIVLCPSFFSHLLHRSLQSYSEIRSCLAWTGLLWRRKSNT